MNKTENFKRVINWMPRVFIISVIFGIIGFILIQSNFVKLPLISLLAIVYIFLILANQIDEIEIQKDSLFFEQKSLLPFLRSKTEIPFGNIRFLDLISDQTMTEKGWLIFQKKQKRILLIMTENGKSIRIKGKVHPKGIEILLKTLQEKIKAADNSRHGTSPQISLQKNNQLERK